MMYLAHFALQQFPFGLTPNTGFYVGLSGHQQAMDDLVRSTLCDRRSVTRVDGRPIVGMDRREERLV